MIQNTRPIGYNNGFYCDLWSIYDGNYGFAPSIPSRNFKCHLNSWISFFIFYIILKHMYANVLQC
jgi:hypothetical protein